MPLKQIFGVLLIIGGVALIGYALFESFGIFQGMKEPPRIFSQENGNEDMARENSEFSQPASEAEFQAQIQQVVAEELQNIIPPESIQKMLNIIVWSIFAGLLFIGGGQLAGVGIKLLKA